MSILRWKDGIDWWIRLDAVTLEEFARDAEVSTYPVETGAILSDHYQPQPRRISLTGVVSDTPSGPNWTNIGSGAGTRAEKAPQPLMRPARVQGGVNRENLGRGASGVLRPISTTVLPSRRLVRANIERARLFAPVWVNVLRAAEGEPVNRITNFILAVDQLIERRVPVTAVISGGIEFKDMMITDYSAPRVSGSGGSVRVRLELQQIIAADPAETVKAAQTRADPAVKSKKDKGGAGGSAPKDKSAAQLRALMRRGSLVIPDSVRFP